ncbi:uncharacterized protein [Euphorbia lathyris]|uniref:uncharacterized protein n=1 Tax=Euphorbia lathyris TaxID=212925 RepID=UPI003313CCC6
MDVNSDSKQEALRLKTIAETKYTNSNLKSALKYAKKAHRLCPDLDHLSSMLTAFKILLLATKTDSDITDWYTILQVEPFSHINTIRKQYKKLALILHPDKNSYLGCEEAFKLVGEGFRILSDKIRRKEYDMKLRIKLQEESTNHNSVVETFWTSCSRCRLLHQFERKYLGHNLMCPGCKKSFVAMEVEEREEEDNEVEETVRVWSERLRRKVVDEKGLGSEGNEKLSRRGEKGDSVGLRKVGGGGRMEDETIMSLKLKLKEGSSGRLRRKMSSTSDEVLEESKPVKTKLVEDMTLAQMQREVKLKALGEKEKLKEKQEDARNELIENEKEEKLRDLMKLGDMKNKKKRVLEKSVVMKLDVRSTLDKRRYVATERGGTLRKCVTLKVERRRGLKSGDLEIMAAEGSKFYDFDTDRAENVFKKGQVWAIYNDERIPRRYGLIDEVVSMNPFVVELSWLDLQSNGDEGLTHWEEMGFYVSCGRFKVSRTASINSLNIFSHIVDCERAAREVYRIYPKKGSVWAIHSEVDLHLEERNPSARDKKSYEIAVFLTTYSEMHGLSMAYLEKVDGFRAVFKRREVGCHAIRLLEKDDIRLLSHQIPAKRLSGDEIPALLKDCWELDPALLPVHLLTDD